MAPSLLSSLAGQQPDRPRELGDGHPLRQCLLAGQAPGEGGHGAPAAEPGPRPPAEDRHGWEDEEDGRVAADSGQQPQEPQGHREPGEGRGDAAAGLAAGNVRVGGDPRPISTALH